MKPLIVQFLPFSPRSWSTLSKLIKFSNLFLLLILLFGGCAKVKSSFGALGLINSLLTNAYSIGGTVTGLSGTGLVLQNNSGDNLTVTANGSIQFATALFSADAYSVNILTQPSSPGQSCSVTSGSGTVVGSNITDVTVSCSTSRKLSSGAVVVDPFNEGGGAVVGGQLYIFNGKVYMGPNSTEDAVLELSYDGSSSTTVSIDGDGVAGAPITPFIGLDNVGNGTLAGIDYFYSGCVGASLSSLTGTGCTGAGGVEHSFIGGFLTADGQYESVWYSTDLTGTRTYTEFSGMEHHNSSYRTSQLAVFKEQLYVVIGHRGSNKPKFSRMCMKAGGCGNGDALNDVTLLAGSFLNHIGRHGTNGNGQSASGQMVGVDSMWEYDNDAGGGNESQLYLAAGGSTAALPSGAGTTTDGGVLRSALARSTSANPPTICTLANCNTQWEDVTPTNAKWLAYMSIALPEETIGGADWAALIPANTTTPAILAVPRMRTAPNGDLYLIRNACSSVTVHSIANVNAQAGGHTCTVGNEIPQLWMLPQGTTATPKGAGDWVLVAEAAATGRTDLSGNAGCTSGVNLCDTENTHISLLEFNGNYLYIGFDNGTNGANIWRTDLSSVASGSAPAEADFSLVGSFGLGDAANNTRLFSTVTVNDGASTDYLHVLSGTGANSLRIFITDNY